MSANKLNTIIINGDRKTYRHEKPHLVAYMLPILFNAERKFSVLCCNAVPIYNLFNGVTYVTANYANRALISL